MNDVLLQKIETSKNLLRRISADFSPAGFASSLGAEDMVLTDFIHAERLSIEIFTLDTGRLPQETHALIDAVGERYGRRPQVYFPQPATVGAYVSSYGTNGFYTSVDLRKSCCLIRKVEPLRRALAGKKAWITGLRREQSESRGDVQMESFDALTGITKFSPLVEWTDHEVWEYIREFDVPYNTLHDRGYPSIGCAPCTRAVAPGEDSRSGRWWWESGQFKECGLHVAADGTLARSGSVTA